MWDMTLECEKFGKCAAKTRNALMFVNVMYLSFPSTFSLYDKK